MNTKQFSIAIVILVLGLSILGCASAQLSSTELPPTAALAPTQILTLTQNPTPTSSEPIFAKDHALEIPSASEITGDGDISFEPGNSPTTVKITVNGTVPVTDQNAICWFCLKTIHIAPGLKIPVEFFGVLAIDTTAKISGGNVNQNLKIVEVNGVRVLKDPPEIASLTYEVMTMDYPLMTNSTNTVNAGDQGLTLTRDGKKFSLVDGAGRLEK